VTWVEPSREETLGCFGGWSGDRTNQREIADAGECSAKLAVVIVISGAELADFLFFTGRARRHL
jgi:hypothetical protein